jgi:hypothetical protein
MDPSAMMSIMGGGNREPNAMARMLDCAGICSQPGEVRLKHTKAMEAGQ